jgi:hypothetical protein
LGYSAGLSTTLGEIILKDLVIENTYSSKTQVKKALKN